MIQRIRNFTSNTTTELRHDIYNTWSLRASAVNYHSRSSRHRLRRERAKKAEKEWTEAENRRIEHEKRTRELFTQKAYHKYADVERMHFPQDMISEKTVHFYGHWQPTNSYIRGHARRGLKRLRGVQRRKGLVVIVNEYNTSKTCHWCLKPLQLQKYRGKDSKVRKCNGACLLRELQLCYRRQRL